MPTDEAAALSSSDQEYLDTNWNDAQGWDDLTDEEKERIFRREARKKQSISEKDIDRYIDKKKKDQAGKAA